MRLKNDEIGWPFQEIDRRFRALKGVSLWILDLFFFGIITFGEERDKKREKGLIFSSFHFLLRQISTKTYETIVFISCVFSFYVLFLIIL